uniref:Ig-like domain-containing protein n=1 Tax=Maylandia zebra TaxID=106582 RepID=A0A3P9DHP7_9CICH
HIDSPVTQHDACETCPVFCFRDSKLIFCLFPGKVLVIGSNLPIVAAPGDDVILPCHLEPMFDVQGLTVEWSKPDLKPDPSDRLSRVEYVHLYRDRKEVPDMKMASYFRRTELFMDDMKHGNISLKILNVSEEDNGRYRCFIPKLQSRVKAAVVELVVEGMVLHSDVVQITLLRRWQMKSTGCTALVGRHYSIHMQVTGV